MSSHTYLSTSCLHAQQAEQGEDGIFDPHHAAELHAYCQNHQGQAGLKKPGECKFCAAKCICPCHQEATDVAS